MYDGIAIIIIYTSMQLYMCVFVCLLMLTLNLYIQWQCLLHGVLVMLPKEKGMYVLYTIITTRDCFTDYMHEFFLHSQPWIGS